MTLNGVMALILRYCTEFVCAVVVKQLLGLFLRAKIYFSYSMTILIWSVWPY